MSHEIHMRRTLELARQGLGTTWPNPMVGAVLVKDGRLIGEGFHVRSGENHAEVNAIENAKETVRGATLYVNLEPCCHLNKKTPPCAQRLIDEGIKSVYVANLDPNPEVSGKGIQLLRDAGVDVHTGICEAEGEKLNEVFFHAQRKQRPFFHLKLATTLDGYIALPSGESQWITGEKARLHAHGLRSSSQAVLIGAGTLRKDNPRLTVRLDHHQGPQPWRIVLTKSGDLPQERHLFQDEFKDRTLVYQQGLQGMVKDLFEKKIIAVLVEGGASLATELLKEGLIDRISLYQNPSLFGAGLTALQDLGVTRLSERVSLKGIDSLWLGEDHYITGRL